MPKRRAAAPARGRPKRSRTPRYDPEYSYEHHPTISQGSSEQPPQDIGDSTLDLSEIHLERIATRVAQQLAGLAGSSNAPATVTNSCERYEISGDLPTEHNMTSLTTSQPGAHTVDQAVDTAAIASMTSNALLGESDNNPTIDSYVDPENVALFDLPVDYHVPQKIKAKIWSNEFVDFGDLLKTKPKRYDNPKEAEAKKVSNHSFLRYNEWCIAFEVFVAIYSIKYPHDTAGLMKYASLIRLLYSNGHAWYTYDQSFRQLRSIKPVPWSKIKSTIWCMATLSKTQKPIPQQNAKPVPFQRRPAENSNQVKGFCWSYNSTGTCVLGWPKDRFCKHRHFCSSCKGNHAQCFCPEKREPYTKRMPYKIERRRF